MRRALLGVAVALSLVALFTTGRPVTPSAGTVHLLDAAPTTTTVAEASTLPPETTTEPVRVPELTTVVDKVSQPPTTRSVPVRTTVAAPVSGSGACGGSLPPCWVMMQESRGDPSAVNWTGCFGRGCFGKWQADPLTSQALGYSGTMDQYPESTQDEFARRLWNGGAGCSNWNAC